MGRAKYDWDGPSVKRKLNNIFLALMQFPMPENKMGKIKVSISSIILKRISQQHEEEELKKEILEYQYYQQNPHTKEYSTGSVFLPKKLNDKESISYTDKNENLFSISKFGESVYKCTGVCYCKSSEDSNDIDNNRRGGVQFTMLKRTLYAIVVAYTLYEAYGESEEWFNEECSYRFSNDCVDGFESEVDDCELTPQKELASRYKKTMQEQILLRFFCYGNCLSNTKLVTQEAKDMSVGFDCDGYRKEGTIDVDCTELDDKLCHHQSRLEFQRKYLFPLCNGLHYVTFEINPNVWKTVYMCTDHNQPEGEDEIIDINVSIKCHKVRGDKIMPKEEPDEYIPEEDESHVY